MDDVKDLFFDLDETLLDFKKTALSTFQYIIPRYMDRLGLERFLEIYLPINNSYWQAYRAQKISRDDLHHLRFKDTFEALDLNISEHRFIGFINAYKKGLVDFCHVLPQVKETLTYLSAEYNLHIITDGFAEIQDEKLKKSAIISYFETVTSSDEVGVTKPHSGIFEAALSRADARKEKSVMIGDNLQFDVWGALNAGMKAIHFTRDKNSDFKGVKIQTIEELKNIF